MQIIDREDSLISRSPSITLRIGRRLGEWARGGDVILVEGPLGAGKSVLARGIAEGLDATTWLGSPTFTIVNEYDTRPALYHVDLYRLSRLEIEDLGLDEYTRRDSVVVVEWPSRAPEYLNGLDGGAMIRVEIELIDQQQRLIRIRRPGDREAHEDRGFDC